MCREYRRTYKIIPLKSFAFQKNAIRAINNLAYNEHNYSPINCNKIRPFVDHNNIHVSNNIFQ